MGEVKCGGTGVYGKWYGPLSFAMTPKCCKDSLIRKQNRTSPGLEGRMEVDQGEASSLTPVVSHCVQWGDQGSQGPQSHD